MTMGTKQEIIKEKLGSYLKASKEDKGRILDVVEDVTGMHRKAIVRRFKTLQLRSTGWHDQRGRPTVYGKGVSTALREIWDMAHEICAERLHPMLHEYITVLARDGMWKHGDEVTGLLCSMSLGTMKNRIESFEHIKAGGGRSTTKPSHLKEIIPIRRGPWHNPEPGYREVDTVAHCGGTLVGDYAYTVQYTDVATIWTCLSAQWNKGEEATTNSIESLQERLPFRLLGIDPDSGSEFINWHMKGWCDERKVRMTRTRPYMKNDHARIEQKNYTNVRQFVGYVRIDNPDAVPIMNELYRMLEDYINFFIPSMKCVEKMRSGSRYVRHYDMPRTAYQRTLECQLIDEDVKERLRQKYVTLNPKILKQKGDRLLRKLYATKSAAGDNSYGNT